MAGNILSYRRQQSAGPSPLLVEHIELTGDSVRSRRVVVEIPEDDPLRSARGVLSVAVGGSIFWAVVLAVVLLLTTGCGGPGGSSNDVSQPSLPDDSSGPPSSPAPTAASVGLYNLQGAHCVVLRPSVACFDGGQTATWRSAAGFEAIRLDPLAGALGILFEGSIDGAAVVFNVNAAELFAQAANGCTLSGTVSPSDFSNLFPVTASNSCRGGELRGYIALFRIAGEVHLFIALADSTDTARSDGHAVEMSGAPPLPMPGICEGLKPADEFAMRACPAGTVGSYEVSRTYTCFPPTWFAGEWQPESPPPGACTPVEPDPPPPPPDPIPDLFATLAADPNPVVPGTATTLTWESNGTSCTASSIDPAWQGSVDAAGTRTTSSLGTDTLYALDCRRGPSLEEHVRTELVVLAVDDTPGCEVTDSCDPPLAVPFAGAWSLEGAYCEFTAEGAFLCLQFRAGSHDIYQGTFSDETHAAGVSCREGAPLPDWSATVGWADANQNTVRVTFSEGLNLEGLRPAAIWAEAPRCP